jgi:hypothetical protein
MTFRQAIWITLLTITVFMGPLIVLNYFPIYEDAWMDDDATNHTNCTAEYEDLALWARSIHGYVFLTSFICVGYGTVIIGMTIRSMVKYQPLSTIEH